MKRLITNSENILAMAKISEKYAIDDIAQNIENFVYFSECNSSHGPKIKFYGGSKQTNSTKKAPALKFNAEGECEVELFDWMNKKNCPKGFDTEYLSRLASFVQTYKSILLLVWFKHLDEDDALEYFHGHIDLEELLSYVDTKIPDNIISLRDLDEYCLSNNLYEF